MVGHGLTSLHFRVIQGGFMPTSYISNGEL